MRCGVTSTGGEVANALVCKTSIRRFNPGPVLQIWSRARSERAFLLQEESRGADHRPQDADGCVEFGEGHAFAAAVGSAHVAGTENDNFLDDRSEEAGFRAEGDGGCCASAEALDPSHERRSSGRFESGLLAHRMNFSVQGWIATAQFCNDRSYRIENSA